MNYPAQQSAQGLASLGRNNDTMLMHVTPREVAGLQSIAMAHGGSLTINPDTGLPEAGFFDSLLTMGAGAILGGPVGLSALETGLLIGGTTLLATGDLGRAFGAGLGGYSGADLGKSFMGFANKSVMPGAPTTAEFNAQMNAPYTGAMGPTGELGADLGFKAGPMGATDQLSQSIGGINTNLPTYSSGQGFQLTPKPIMNAANVDTANILNPKVPGVGVQNLDAWAARPDMAGSAINLEKFPTGLSSPSAKTGVDALTSGVSQAASSPAEFANYLGEGNTLKGTGKLALTGAGLFSDELIKPPPTNIYEDPDKGKWLSATGGLNLSDRFGNLNLAASGGVVEDDRIKSYALGGIVSNPSVGGGISDLYNRPEGQTTETISQDGYGIGRLNSLANAEAMTDAKILGYAEGGETSLNLDRLPSLNLGTGRQGYSGGSGDVLASMDPNDPMVQQFFRPGIEKLRAQNNALYGDGPDNILNTMGPNDPIMQKFLRPGIEKMRAQNNALYGTAPLMSTDDPMGRMLNSGVDKMRAQHSSLYGMAHGGYLNGAGDGMSDSIPATIEGKQPARLADGEFVVPADVVSHLGNGSSKAGSKRLYAMLDKVRQARTGHTKQGKQIKAEKYLPA